MVVDVKMEVTINVFNDMESAPKVHSDKAFFNEMKEDYLNAEVFKKREQLMEYEEEYNQLEDKDSIKAQYLDSWIFVLKEEIEEMKS